MITFALIQIMAYPGESIKLVIISLDELNHPTSDNIQIQESMKINVRMCMHVYLYNLCIHLLPLCVHIISHKNY